MLTRKDYEAIAKVLLKAKDNPYAWEYIVLELAYYFHEENSRFGRSRFLKACGKEEE